jgi:HK97 family phage prohead protease
MNSTKGHQRLKREVRTHPSASRMTVRTTADGSKQVSGYAIVFNSPSVDLGGFTEICSASMLNRTLKENPDVLALRDHKQELLIGRTLAGTLELKTDAKGLAFTITLPKTNIGDDTWENIRIANLSGVSFGFNCQSDSWAADANGNPVRTLLDVDLFEISITSFPAYQATTVNTRSCPTSLRAKLTKRDADDDVCNPDSPDYDPDACDDDDEERCSCDCQSCLDGDCDGCTDEDCDDEDCEACPMQDESRADSIRVRQLFAHRQRVL